MEAIFALIYFFLSISTAILARKKGRSGFGFFLSSLLCPGIALIGALIANPNVEKLENKLIKLGLRKKCPNCAEIVKKEAIICKHCKQEILI